MKILWIIFGGQYKTVLFFLGWGGSFLCILWSFLKVKVQNGNIFGGLLKFQIFFGVCLIFLISFFNKQYMLGLSLHSKKK